MYFDELGQIPLLCPPLDEQAAIVRFLDHANGKIERAIRTKRKLIVLLNEQKHAIIHRAVNLDIAGTCTIDGKAGLFMVEAKAHDEELRKEESGKKLKPPVSAGSRTESHPHWIVYRGSPKCRFGRRD